MAKIDKSSVKAEKKPKGIKRKHEANDDDAVAPKSVILSRDSIDATKKKKKPKKLKTNTETKSTENQSKSTKKSRKRKASLSDEEMIEPTLEQIRESEKPENIKSIVTVRQKKRQKHQQRLEVQKNQDFSKDIAKNAEYLQKWKNNRELWKFEKLRQISVQQSVFDESRIDAEVWPIALEYLSGSKGAAKETIKKLAEAVIDELDKEIECGDVDSTVITKSEKYRRARELLQSLD